jgi:hypothetical protein
VVGIHSQDKSMLIALLCFRNCGRHTFTGQGYVNSFLYVLGTVVGIHSQDKAMLIALLWFRNCGRHTFTGQGYVNSFVMF